MTTSFGNAALSGEHDASTTEVHGSSLAAIDLFAGPGGWDEGIRPLDIEPLGIEFDADACDTRKVARHRTLAADVAALDPLDFAPCELLIASPPCQAFSAAGKGDGQKDVPIILHVARALGEGRDVRAEAQCSTIDNRSLLVVEPLRWALALRPTFVALEQVPPVLALWKVFAEALRDVGYSCWAGVLSAEAYGVPQTRERAFLMASLAGSVTPPRATHQAYEFGVPAQARDTLEGRLEPWISMAAALGWSEGERAYKLHRGSGMNERHGERPDTPDDRPAPVMTSKARTASWVETRPATTIAGDSRVFQPGGHHQPGEQSQNAVRVTKEEAAILQGFRPDYPFMGSRTKQFTQIGNAVPPPLARAVVKALVGDHLRVKAAA